MTMTAMRVAPTQSFEVERGVTDWVDEKRTSPNDIRNILKFMGALMVAITIGLTTYPLIIPTTGRDPIEAVWTAVGGGAISVVVIAITMSLLWKTRDPVIAAKEESRNRAKALRSSRQTAKALGGSVIPTLTKEHVEAMARLGLAVAGNGVTWSKRETERVRALLLEDFDRADALISLIESHEAVSFEQVLAELADMEAKPKPLQGGWL